MKNLLNKTVIHISLGLLLFLYSCTSDDQQQAEMSDQMEESQQEAAGFEEEPEEMGQFDTNEQMDSEDSPEMYSDEVYASETNTPEAIPMHDENTNMDDTRRDKFEYIVMKGDSLSKIAERVFGDRFKWTEIAELNATIKNPDRIYPGDIIQIPVSNEASTKFSEDYIAKKQDSMVTETIKEGDTLSKIAKRVLGDSGSWKQIWQQNKGLIPNPNKITVGQTISFSTGLSSYSH